MLYPARSASVLGAQIRSTNGGCPTPEATASSPDGTAGGKLSCAKTFTSVVSSPSTSAGKPPAEVEGDDTTEVKVFAHDSFPPAVPSGLEAVASGVGQPPFVDLIWSPNTDADLAGYNIYRHEEGTAPVKINSEVVKTPTFRDTTVVGSKKYFYSVSAVDLRGNESARSEEASEAVPGANEKP